MAEILTESFCERCGARYTFEAAARRRRGLGRIRTLSRGVRNFVANDDASFAEAMAAAREDDERRASLQQLDAFHGTFTFCMSCRQYTCPNCWNASVGECMSCAPDFRLEARPASLQDATLAVREEPRSSPASASPTVAASAWPMSDRRSTWDLPAMSGPPEAEPAVALEPAPAPEAEPAVALEPAPAPEAEPAVALEPEAEPAVALEPALEPEAEPAVALEPEAEPAVALEPEPEPAVALEPAPEPAVALEPEPEPAVALEPAPEPAVALEPAPEAVDSSRPDELEDELTPAELLAIQEVLARQVGRPTLVPLEAPGRSVDSTVPGVPLQAVSPAEAASVEAPPAEAIPVAAVHVEPIPVDRMQAEAVAPEAVASVPPDAGPAEVSVAAIPADAVPAEDIAVAPTPGERSPGGTVPAVAPDAVTDPRDETRRFLGRFRPGRHRDVPARAYSASADDARAAASAEPVAGTDHPAQRPALADEAAAMAPERVAAAASPVEVVGLAQPEPKVVATETLPVAVEPEPEPIAAETLPVAEEAAAEILPVPAEPEPEPIAAETLPVAVEPEPEPIAAETLPVAAEPEPEPIAAETLPVAVELAAAVPVAVEPEPEPVTAEIAAAQVPAAHAAPRTDVVVQPAWRMVAPDGGAPDEPQPDLPAWATPVPAARRSGEMPAASWAARVATARPVESPVWADSSRNLLAATPPGAAGPVAVQSCVSCGLSLSASARFCRRCGTRQG